MIILQASDLPYVSISRSEFRDVWRLQELKVSHTKSPLFSLSMAYVRISVANSIYYLAIEFQVL